MGWIEARASELRAAAGIRGGVGCAEMERLIAALHERVDVWESPDPDGLCVHWPDGTADVWIPPGGRYLESLAHELGHALLTTGLARRLHGDGAPTWRLQQIREEGIANRFAAALLAWEATGCKQGR